MATVSTAAPTTATATLELIDAPANVRDLDREHVESLKASIALLGLLVPVTLRPTGKGRFELVAGFHCLAAVRELGWSEIPYTLHDQEQVAAARAAENIARKQLSLRGGGRGQRHAPAGPDRGRRGPGAGVGPPRWRHLRRLRRHSPQHPSGGLSYVPGPRARMIAAPASSRRRWVPETTDRRRLTRSVRREVPVAQRARDAPRVGVMRSCGSVHAELWDRSAYPSTSAQDRSEPDEDRSDTLCNHALDGSAGGRGGPMTSAVSANDAANSVSPLAGASSSASMSPQPMTIGHQTPVTPAEAGLGDLTAADWNLISASVGKDVGPDASGKIQPLQPTLAFAIEAERQSGYLAPGQELTLGDMKNMAVGQQSSGFLDQIHNAIAYLEQDLQTALGSSSGRAINIAA